MEVAREAKDQDRLRTPVHLARQRTGTPAPFPEVVGDHRLVKGAERHQPVGHHEHQGEAESQGASGIVAQGPPSLPGRRGHVPVADSPHGEAMKESDYARRRRCFQSVGAAWCMEPIASIRFYADTGELSLGLKVLRAERSCEECGIVGLPGERMYRPASDSRGWCCYCGMVLSGNLRSKFLEPRMCPGESPVWMKGR